MIALTAGICVVLLAGVFDRVQRAVPALTLVALAAAAGLLIWQWDEGEGSGQPARCDSTTWRSRSR